MSKWINVKDALPSKPGEYFVVLLDPLKKYERHITVDQWDGNDWFMYPRSFDDMRWPRARYWMECPEIPKEQEK